MHSSASITDPSIRDANTSKAGALAEDFEHLDRQLERRGVDIETLVQAYRQPR
jgi:L-rhamnose isomerase